MSSPRWTRRVRPSAIALVVVAAMATAACSAGGATPERATQAPPSTTMNVAGTEPPAPSPRPTSVDDTTPAAVVASFVAAEAAEAYDLSLPLLATADREAAGTLDAWTDHHAALWPLRGAEVIEVSNEDGTAAEVTTRLTYRSQLDETVGLVPARAEGRWKVVREGDRWRISLADLEVEPTFPDDRAAVDSAKAWSAARQACSIPGEQYPAGLVAFPTVADGLCGSSGDIVAGAASKLAEGSDADAFVAAFGPQVIRWARVVPVQDPVSFRAVLAPVGDRWIVAGLLPPR